ncbi:hypothetical protein ACFXKC_46050 [Streptomyces sp. NPDC059340]|uniref:hypothetical protein n=1 Tax=Streptomyces sp. NPDC059340 TaxID=3346806 RepID=UPI0036A88946
MAGLAAADLVVPVLVAVPTVPPVPVEQDLAVMPVGADLQPGERAVHGEQARPSEVLVQEGQVCIA